MGSLKGLEKWGWNIIVRVSKGISSKVSARRRSFVGGLPEFPDQETMDLKIQELFEGYELSSISKLNVPRDIQRMEKRGIFSALWSLLVNMRPTERCWSSIVMTNGVLEVG